MAIIGGGLIVREMKRTKFTYDPWAIVKTRLVAWFLMALTLGATTGYFFISPTDGWVEIITGALVISLMLTVVEVMGAGVYFRWRKDRLSRVSSGDAPHSMVESKNQRKI